MRYQHLLLRRYRRAGSGRRFRAYSEAAFRYLLTVERERCRRAGRLLVLVLVDAQAPVGGPAALNRRLARKVFASLARSLRETDVVGWYLDRRVAGAVLTEVAGKTGPDVADLVAGRVSRSLRAGVPRSLANRLRVRLSLNPEPLFGGVAW